MNLAKANQNKQFEASEIFPRSRVVNIRDIDRSPRLTNQTALNVTTAKLLYTPTAKPVDTNAHTAMEKTVILQERVLTSGE